MNLRIHILDEIAPPFRAELCHAHAVELEVRQTLVIETPNAIAYLAPQGEDVLMVAEDGSQFLILNFLSTDHAAIELLGLPRIRSNHFASPTCSSFPPVGEKEVRPLLAVYDGPSPALAQVAFSALPLDRPNRYDPPPLSGNGESLPDLRWQFETISTFDQPAAGLEIQPSLPFLNPLPLSRSADLGELETKSDAPRELAIWIDTEISLPPPHDFEYFEVAASLSESVEPADQFSTGHPTEAELADLGPIQGPQPRPADAMAISIHAEIPLPPPHDFEYFEIAVSLSESIDVANQVSAGHATEAELAELGPIQGPQPRPADATAISIHAEIPLPPPHDFEYFEVAASLSETVEPADQFSTGHATEAELAELGPIQGPQPWPADAPAISIHAEIPLPPPHGFEYFEVERGSSEANNCTYQSNTHSAPESSVIPESSVLPAIASATVEEPMPFSFCVAEYFGKPETRHALRFQASLPDGTDLPAWLRFDLQSGSFSGTPTCDDIGMTPVRIVASEGSTQDEDIFAIIVASSGNSRAQASVATTRVPRRDNLFALNFAAMFEHLASSTLRYSATSVSGADLPEWLNLDENAGILSGRPRLEDLGSISLLAIASHGTESTNQLFTIDIDIAHGMAFATLAPEIEFAPTWTARPEPTIAAEDLIALNSPVAIESDLTAEDEPSPFRSDGEAHAEELAPVEVSWPEGKMSETPDVELEMLELSPFRAEIELEAETGAEATLILESADESESRAELHAEPSVEQVSSFALEYADSVAPESAPELECAAERHRHDSTLEFNFEDRNYCIHSDSDANPAASQQAAELRYEAVLSDGSCLPDWLVLDPLSGSFSFRANRCPDETISVTLTMREGVESVSEIIELRIENRVSKDSASSDGFDLENLPSTDELRRPSEGKPIESHSYSRIPLSQLERFCDGGRRLVLDDNNIDLSKVGGRFAPQGLVELEGKPCEHLFDPLTDTHLYIPTNLDAANTSASEGVN